MRKGETSVGRRGKSCREGKILEVCLGSVYSRSFMVFGHCTANYNVRLKLSNPYFWHPELSVPGYSELRKQ